MTEKKTEKPTQRERVDAVIDRINALAHEHAAINFSAAMRGLVKMEKSLAKSIRAAKVNDSFDIVQQRGPRLKFNGRLIAEVEHETGTSGVHYLHLEIFETNAGALIAVSTFFREFDTEDRSVSALVVHPMDDVQAMHFAVMEHFRWSHYARKMAGKLGWDLSLEVE
ncbi:hypothetical protein GRI39_01885 [Altererythrobacter indicus]|uniref:Uncharacterized protein n=1 Tax=Altericroceibacterium indicum TaxID=374177 RepID=A0A845A8A4_9SPHN|nr:hypothetical protein [Altericroceibacterium indicum]MXP24796.1 hypothetical protein [Altericroceibacterium indicum]